MSSKTHLEWIYNRLIEVHGENELYDYMIKFKEIIEEVNLNEAYLLDAVTKLVRLTILPMQEDLCKYLLQKDFKMDDELKMLVDVLIEKEESIYKQYGIVKHTSGKIEETKYCSCGDNGIWGEDGKCGICNKLIWG